MICRKAQLWSAAASVGLLAAVQAAQAQPVHRADQVRSGDRLHRADYIRAPQDYGAGYYYDDYYGDDYRTAYHERRYGRRQTYCRTVRRGSRTSTSCRTRQSERIQRRRIILPDRYYDVTLSDRRDRRTDYYQQRGRDHYGVSFGVWYDAGDRSYGRAGRSSSYWSGRSHGYSPRHAVQHRSRVRSYRGHNYRRTSGRQRIERGRHRR